MATLALGIGAATPAFTLVHRVLVASLPYGEGDRLVYIRHSAALAGLENVLFSVPEIADIRARATTLEEVTEFSALPFTQLGWGEPREVRAGIVTGNFFSTMGLGALAGRVIGPGDDGPTASPVAVLTADYWSRAFGSDPSVIGLALELGGRSVTVVGVAEPAPPYPEETDLYVNLATSPHHLGATMTHDRTHRMTEVFARLAPGSTVQGARAEVRALHEELRARHPDAYDSSLGYGVSLRLLREQLAQRARPGLLLLLGVTGFVFLLASANVVNLTLARILRRGPELEMRAVLGATRAELRIEVLRETLILSTCGVLLGMVVARVTMTGLGSFAASLSVLAEGARLSLRSLGFAAALGGGVALAAAVLPPLPVPGERRGGQGGRGLLVGRSGPTRRRLENGLVVGQVALALCLLVGAGHFARSLWSVMSRDPGIRVEGLLVADLPTVPSGRTREEASRYYEEIVLRIGRIAGVEGAGLTTRVPLRGSSLPFDWPLEVSIDGHGKDPDGGAPRADFRPLTPGAFQVLGLRLVEGRYLRDGDGGKEVGPVVVVNEAFARRYLSGGAVGRAIRWTDPVRRFLGVSDAPRRVVGVVEDSRDWGLDTPARPTVYMPYLDAPVARSLVARTRGEPDALVEPIRAAIRGVGPDQPIERIATMEKVVRDHLGPRRLNALLVGGLAALSLVIACVGLGGALGFSVARRTRELGVRAVLGAERGRILRLVLGEGVRLVLAGLVLGAALAWPLVRVAEATVPDLGPGDPTIVIVVSLLLLGVGMCSALPPALWAAAVEPVVAMRRE